MTGSGSADAVTRLLDRQAIADVLLLYSRAVDRKDYDALDRCYWPDAFDNHIFYKGDYAGFKLWVVENTRDACTTHFQGNMLIEQFSADSACVETYSIVIHDGPGGAGSETVVMGGRFLDRLEKRGGEWRIAHREVTVDFQMRGPSTAAWTGVLATAASRGSSKPHDALYRLHPTA
jgi:hypothetical protein